MNTVDDLIKLAADNAEKISSRNARDYVGENGLLFCAECNSPKQTKINVFGKNYVVYCMCKCAETQFQNMKKNLKSQEIEILKSKCFRNKEMWNMTFDNDLFDLQQMKTARLYVDNFDSYAATGKGLCLYGDVGTGKTYMAAAIANALIELGKSVFMSTLGNIRALLFDAKSKTAFYDFLNSFNLLIIDDLGAESDSDYMKEFTFTILDNRISAKLPLIITSNLTFDDFKNPNDISKKRLYSRIWKVCNPVHFVGNDIRKIYANENVKQFKIALSESTDIK